MVIAGYHAPDLETAFVGCFLCEWHRNGNANGVGGSGLRAEVEQYVGQWKAGGGIGNAGFEGDVAFAGFGHVAKVVVIVIDFGIGETEDLGEQIYFFEDACRFRRAIL